MNRLGGALTLMVLAGVLIAWVLWPADRSPEDGPESDGAGVGDSAEQVIVTGEGLRGDGGDRVPTLTSTGDRRPTRNRASGGRIHGRFIDASTGVGVSGGWVQVVRYLGDDEFETPPPTACRSGGFFVIDGLMPGSWLMVPLHREYAHPFTSALCSGWRSDLAPWREDMEELWDHARGLGLVVDIVAGDPAAHEVDLELSSGAHIVGQVTGPGGVPVANASVHLDMPHLYPGSSLKNALGFRARSLPLARTDADGRFDLRCFMGGLDHVRFGARKDGLLGKWSAPLTLETGMSLDLRLYEPAGIEGTVRWEDGSPEPGARLKSHFPDGWMLSRRERPRATANGEGAFVLAGLPPDDVRLSYWPANDAFSGSLQKIADLREGEVRSGVTLALPNRELLSGVLVSTEGTPLSGEKICGYPLGRHDEALQSARTDEEGRFTLELQSGVAVDLWLETAQREERLREGVRPSPELQLVAQATPKVSLRITARTPDGEAVSSFDVRGGSMSGGKVFDEFGYEGEARLVLRGAAPYWIAVGGPEDTKGKPLPGKETGVFPIAAGTKDLVVRLGSRPMVFGRVTDPNGSPLPGAELRLTEFEDYEPAGTHVVPLDAAGFFRFHVKATDDPYVELASIRGSPGYREIRSPRSEMYAGEFHRLMARGGGEALRGRIETQDQDDGSVAGLRVSAFWPDEGADDAYDVTHVITDDHGSFLVPALPAGRDITLYVWAEDLAERRLVARDGPHATGTFRAGAKEAVLHVRKGLSLAGHIAGPGLAGVGRREFLVRPFSPGGFMEGEHLQARPSSAAPGFALHPLRPGRYGVAVLDTDGSSRVLGWLDDVAAGSSGHVIYLPRLTGTLSGAVDLTGVPPADSVTLRVRRQSGPWFTMYAKIKGGTFRVDRLDPKGRYIVDLAVRTEDGAWVAIAAPVVPGEEVTLRPRPELTITGRVQVAAVSSGILLRAQRDGVTRTVGVDAQGNFKVSRLVPGDYTLSRLDENHEPVGPTWTVAAGSKDVVLGSK